MRTRPLSWRDSSGPVKSSAKGISFELFLSLSRAPKWHGYLMDKVMVGSEIPNNVTY